MHRQELIFGNDALGKERNIINANKFRSLEKPKKIEQWSTLSSMHEKFMEHINFKSATEESVT